MAKYVFVDVTDKNMGSYTGNLWCRVLEQTDTGYKIMTSDNKGNIYESTVTFDEVVSEQETSN